MIRPVAIFLRTCKSIRLHQVSGAIALMMCLLSSPSAIAETPDFSALPEVSTTGKFATSEDGLAWLSVEKAGLYRLSLDGPGILVVSRFRTPNGRSLDGSETLDKLAHSGSYFDIASFDEVILEPGHSYLLRTSVIAPRSVVLEFIAPLERSLARLSSEEGVIALRPGSREIIAVDAAGTFDLEAPEHPLWIEVLKPFGVNVDARIGQMYVQPGGLLPVVVGADMKLNLHNKGNADEAPPLVVLRTRAAPAGLDDIEPGPVVVDVPSATGATLKGILGARSDRDKYEFQLHQESRFDIELQVAENSKAILRLEELTDIGARQVIQATTEPARARRAGLLLPAGRYRMTVESTAPKSNAYSVSILPSQSVDPLGIGEPDDTPERARRIEAGNALIGHLDAQDPDHIWFEVPTPDRVWEIRAVQGIDTLHLSTSEGQSIGTWSANRGAVVLSLALQPGRYVIRLRGTGRYGLRFSDGGPRPPGFETEPNDGDATAHRLFPGDRVQGNFLLGGDRDLFEVVTQVPTPLTLTLRGVDDGTTVADLKLSDGQVLRAEQKAGQPDLSYSALFPAGRNLIALRPASPGLSGWWQLSLDRSEIPEDGEPDGTLALPADGQVTSKIGGFDAGDKVFVALPEGTGEMMLACTGALRSADLRTYGDDMRLLRLEAGVAGVIAYGPELGGAVELRLEAGELPGLYTCQFAYSGNDGTFKEKAHEETKDGDGPTQIRSGERVVGEFGDGDRGDRIIINLPDEGLAGFACKDGKGTALDPRRIRPIGTNNVLSAALRQPGFADGTLALFGDEKISHEIEILPKGDDNLWSCTLIGADRFRTPAEMGPSAPFTAPLDRSPDPTADALANYDPQAALAVLSGGRAGWLASTQVVNDLDVSLDIEGLETPFRSFSRLGQEAKLNLLVTNGAKAADLELEAQLLADGWQLKVDRNSVSLAAHEKRGIGATLVAPPMQSDVTRPAVRILVRSGEKRRAATIPVLMDPLVPDRNPVRFWSAPAGLRGGLNPLQYQFGARVISEDGEVIDERRAETLAPLHDGSAQHTNSQVKWNAGQTVLKLAEKAPVVGMMLHLRSANSRKSWPDRVTVQLSEDGEIWEDAFDVTPSASDHPQYFELPQAITAGFARLIRHGCRGSANCASTTLAEIGLVADPSWRFSWRTNIADPSLGGHVVYARELGGTANSEQVFGGNWNIGLLTEGRAAKLSRGNEKRGDQIEAVLGFHETRVAKIAAIEWRGHVDDKDPTFPMTVEASVEGPAGPWRSVGILNPPDEAGASQILTFETPIWARSLRLRFDRSQEGNQTVPNQLRVWEDPTAPQIHGFWEDDRPDAGYEAIVAPPPVAAPQPSGGLTAQDAVDLAASETVQSSVQLERNSDWWKFTIPEGPHQMARFVFPGMVSPDVVAHLQDNGGNAIALHNGRTRTGDHTQDATLGPGTYRLEILEPPRSTAISWDTSGSVGAYIPRTLAAVRVWAQSLVPGRDRLQLLPFGAEKFLLANWAERPADVIPALIEIETHNSSDAEGALSVASAGLAGEPGQRGIVIFTDAETKQTSGAWRNLLLAHPKVVVLSIDTSEQTGETIMKDWVSINDGYFLRVVGQAGLADGMDIAAALFRGPKGYALELSLTDVQEPEGTAQLRIESVEGDDADMAPTGAPTGAIEVILDASGSMLKRLPDGQRRITVAHRALTNLVQNSLPVGTPFAFRAFGLEEDACQSELMLPLGPLDPKAATKAIEDVPAINLARTAIARSLVLAADDLAGQAPPLVIVLVTDGEETCDGDVYAEIARIRDRGIDLRLTIVGFAIDDAKLAATFAQWAEAGGGQYLAAGDAVGLGAAIDAAIAPQFALERLFLDGRVEPMGVIGLADEKSLPAGQYRLSPMQTAQGSAIELFLEPDADFALSYDRALGLLPIERIQQ